MHLTQYRHVALLVTDLSRAEAFYSNVLGLAKVERPLNFPGCWYQLGDVQIHLITTEHPLPPLANSDKWGRNPHIAFAVADLEAAKAVLLQAGAPVQMSASGRPALFTQDPDGNILELSQG